MGRQLKISTFGSFQISDGVQDCDVMNKQSKMWSVLKYLIAFYGKPVPADRLADAIWASEDYDDPSKVLRNMIYRLRKTLVTYGGETQYILYDKGNYFWNPEADCQIDVLEFNRLLNLARDTAKPNEERIILYNNVIDLYNGPFLGDSATEVWMLVFTDYYRRLFLQVVNELANLYESNSLPDDIVMLCDRAIASEPYEESLYIRQIQTLIDNGEYVHAKQQYRSFEHLILREFGTKPSQSLERLSYEIDKATNNEPGGIDEITQLLETGSTKQGAFFCGPETFRQIYTFDKRAEERIQFPVFLALIVLTIPDDVEESRRERELKESMKLLRNVLVKSLRNGDVIAQYSKCQFVLMLTALNEEGGMAALRRMKYLFTNKYGKERGQIEYHLSPIGKEKQDPRFDGGDSRKSFDELS